MDAAERIAREAERRACLVLIRSTDEYDAVNSLLIFFIFLLFRVESFCYNLLVTVLQSSFPEEDTVIFVVSTTGQGDTPDSMKARLVLIIYL